MAGEQLRFADVEMDIVSHSVRRGGRNIPLGPTEFRLLRHLLEHPRRVFSRERLLDVVWGRDKEIEICAPSTSISAAFARRSAFRQARADPHGRQAGYALDDEAA